MNQDELLIFIVAVMIVVLFSKGRVNEPLNRKNEDEDLTDWRDRLLVGWKVNHQKLENLVDKKTLVATN